VLVALGSSACGGSHTSSASVVEHAVVGYVTDGDTLRLTDGGRVRIVQIDAPELDTDCYGKAARRALIRLAPAGSRVTLERDPVLDAVDRYGRLLRYVSVAHGDVGLALVGEGAAEPYFFHGDRGRDADELLATARRAQAARRGLWGACPSALLAPAIGSVTGPPETARTGG
jgi:endonuclease YncB( thermonuclease family)